MPQQIRDYLNQEIIDFNNPFDRALFKDLLKIYQPPNGLSADSLLQAIDAYRQKQMRRFALNEQYSRPGYAALLQMYFRFSILFVLVMLITYYGVQTWAVWRFIRRQQGGATSYLKRFFISIGRRPVLSNAEQRLRFGTHLLVLLLKALLTALLYLILFSPAYVTAYSVKSDFNTSSDLFILLLGVVSNGLLITYANKFYTLLKTESRKGYVQTARVKNLNNDYSLGKGQSFSYRQILGWPKHFENHVFGHIYRNARMQYLATIKEQASYLISGLIIIEMALNIHGHLSYELLRQLLYKNYDLVILMVAGIFYMVKLTELFSDYLSARAEKKIAN